MNLARLWSGCFVLLLVLQLPLAAQPASGEDAAAITKRLQQLTAAIEGMSGQFLPEARLRANNAALFRGSLSAARDALAGMVAMGEPAIPHLARLLRSPKAQLRANAAWALGQLGGPLTVAPLAAAAADAQAAVRYQVAQSLAYTASAGGLAPLNQLAGDRETAVAQIAVEAGGVLADILLAEQAETDEARLTALTRLLSADAAVMRMVAYGEAAVPYLVRGLDSTDRGIKYGAALGLSRSGDPRGLDPLWTRFDASVTRNQVETKFAQALSQYRSAEVWPYLVRLLNTKVPAAQYYALERMLIFDHPDRLRTVNEFLRAQVAAGAHREEIKGQELEINPLITAARVLGLIGDATSLQLLQQVSSEAPAGEKSLVKPFADAAATQIRNRQAG